MDGGQREPKDACEEDVELVGDGGMVDGVGGSDVLIGEGAMLLVKLHRLLASGGLVELFEDDASEVLEEEDFGGNMAR